LEYLGLYNKPKAEVHPGHKLTGPKEEEEVVATYSLVLCRQSFQWYFNVHAHKSN